MCVCMLVAQSWPTLCDPVDCSPPGSSIHGILQARIWDCVAVLFFRGSSWLGDWTWVCRITGRFCPLSHLGNTLLFIIKTMQIQPPSLITLCLAWCGVVYISNFISSSKGLCKGAGIISTAELKIQTSPELPKADDSYGLNYEARPHSCGH